MATIFTAWQGVRERIAKAAAANQREINAVALLAVSKTFPSEAIRELYLIGQRAFGENYVQELIDKHAALIDCNELVWHFIGPLQSNKTRSVAELADWVHSIDRLKIAERLSAQRPEHLPHLNVCIQVNVSGEVSKSGIAPDECLTLATKICQLPRIQLRGLMCIPEPTPDLAQLAKQFKVLRDLQNQLITQGIPVDTLSMGMSSDLETAISEGSTLVRVGTALFGTRTYL
ncbi:YggS family pyridoxal phosphate-dependent enzyme [Janthinobacterium sp. B9-8]|uniref:YggS family pyridoxal phosphate-dependent enzyme n=1 Tax=Janthinobacterium sp. B9-8 TaxID=1236179 RepID=UPI00061D2620|nr:YggS family pyridoxal phosphate-dependent enzyme [Janthinobacterium sp. B9-8]AMC35586.1 YggS family pyridoxal phosphate enzyme [Janthinobacterium sp. B9-8]